MTRERILASAFEFNRGRVLIVNREDGTRGLPAIDISTFVFQNRGRAARRGLRY